MLVRSLPDTPVSRSDDAQVHTQRRQPSPLLPPLRMRRPASLRVTPLSRLGAEITGISLRASLANGPVAAQVRPNARPSGETSAGAVAQPVAATSANTMSSTLHIPSMRLMSR